jgi:AraC-like DNA-binding protein
MGTENLSSARAICYVVAVPIHLHHPRSPLNAFIRVMCLSEDYRPEHALERILPDGSITLAVLLNTDALRVYEPDGTWNSSSIKGSLICGPHSTFHVIDTQCQASLLTVHFHPGGAFPFFDMPVDQVANQKTPLAELWNGDAGPLRERLLAARSPADKFAMMEAVLGRRLQPGRKQSRAVPFALRQLTEGSAHRSMAALADEIGLSQRRFIQLFRAEVGLTPKAFARVRRFHAVLNRLQASVEPDWADVTFDCGYYDQAHFIHEFKEFCGMSPARYHASRGEHPLHLPVQNRHHRVPLRD